MSAPARTDHLGMTRLVPVAGTSCTIPRDPQAFCALLARAAVEVSLGIRPHAQLARWVSEEVFVYLARLTVVARPERPRGALYVRTVRAQQIDDTLEGVVVLDDGTRARMVVIAARWQRGRWLATSLRIPPH